MPAVPIRIGDNRAALFDGGRKKAAAWSARKTDDIWTRP